MATKELKTKKVRGTMEYLPEDKLVFTPHGTGQPQYEKLKTTPSSALMRTTGEKTQSLVAHLKVPADAVDPAADLRDQLENVLKALPQSQRMASLRGRRLMDEDYCQVRHNQSQGRIEIGITIDLTRDVNFEQKFYKTSMEISQCLLYNRDSLKKQCIALANASTK